MEEFERLFEQRNGMIIAMKLVTEAAKKVTVTKNSIAMIDSIKNSGVYDVQDEFYKLFDKKWKELGG